MLPIRQLLLHFSPVIAACIAVAVSSLLGVLPSGDDIWFILPLLITAFYAPFIHLPLFGKTIRGWRIFPGGGRVCLRARRICMDWAHLPKQARIAAVYTPFDRHCDLRPRSQSSGLLMATAAGLTIDAIPPCYRTPLIASLRDSGMQPERTAARWTVLGRTPLFGCEAVIVQDGKAQRYFLTGTPEQLLPHLTHVWADREYPLTGEFLEQIRGTLPDGQQCAAALSLHTACYCTGVWTEDGPATVTYLGACMLTEDPADTVVRALERCRLPLADEPGSDVLLVTGDVNASAPLRMCCEDGDPASFPEVLAELDARRQKLRRSYVLCFIAVILLHAAVLQLPAAMLMLVPYFSLAVLLPMISFLRRKWHIRLPASFPAVLLLLGAVPLLTVGLRFLAGTVSILTCANTAFVLTCVWGFCSAMLMRQPKRGWILTLLLTLVWLVYAAGLAQGALPLDVPASPLAAAFGTVLGLLWTLPWYAMKLK